MQKDIDKLQKQMKLKDAFELQEIINVIQLNENEQDVKEAKIKLYGYIDNIHITLLGYQSLISSLSHAIKTHDKNVSM